MAYLANIIALFALGFAVLYALGTVVCIVRDAITWYCEHTARLATVPVSRDTYTARYIVRPMTIDERLCRWLAPRYTAILLWTVETMARRHWRKQDRIVASKLSLLQRLDVYICTSLAKLYPSLTARFTYHVDSLRRLIAWCDTADHYIVDHGIRGTMIAILLNGEDRMNSMIKDMVRTAVRDRLQSIVRETLVEEIQALDLDSMLSDSPVASKVSEPSMVQSKVVTLDKPKTVKAPKGPTPDCTYKLNSKGQVSVMTLRSAVDGDTNTREIDCQNHRFRCEPHSLTGSPCLMTQGTTTKEGRIVGLLNNGNVCCLTSKGGIVARKLDSLAVDNDQWLAVNAQAVADTTDMVPQDGTSNVPSASVPVATAAGLPVASPQYKGDSPIAFVADGELITRDGVVVTVNAKSTKGALWLSDPSSLPSALLNGAQTVVPVVYS